MADAIVDGHRILMKFLSNWYAAATSDDPMVVYENTYMHILDAYREWADAQKLQAEAFSFGLEALRGALRAERCGESYFDSLYSWRSVACDLPEDRMRLQLAWVKRLLLEGLE